MLPIGAERRTFLKSVMDVTTGLSGTRSLWREVDA